MKNRSLFLTLPQFQDFLWACRRRMFESQRIEAIEAPTTKHSETRESFLRDRAKGAFSLLLESPKSW